MKKKRKFFKMNKLNPKKQQAMYKCIHAYSNVQVARPSKKKNKETNK